MNESAVEWALMKRRGGVIERTKSGFGLELRRLSRRGDERTWRARKDEDKGSFGSIERGMAFGPETVVESSGEGQGLTTTQPPICKKCPWAIDHPKAVFHDIKHDSQGVKGAAHLGNVLSNSLHQPIVEPPNRQ